MVINSFQVYKPLINYLGSNDTTLKVWNTKTMNCEAHLKGHTKWVFSA